MKKSILFVLILFTVSAFAQTQQAQPTTLKLGWVDSQIILAQLPEAIKAKADLEGMVSKWRKDLDSMQTDYQKFLADNQKQAETMKKEELQKYPKEEIYTLTSQIRRAVISIPSNIAEGAGHFSNKEFSRFLGIAYASSCELDTQIILSFDLDYISKEELNDSSVYIEELQKMLSGLIKSLQKKN